MEFNLNNDNMEQDSLLKQKQKIESMRFDLLKSELELTKVIAAKELDKLKRQYHNLEDLVSRLQQDIKISREREAKDQEKINDLLTQLERNDKDYTEMLAKLNAKVLDLECVSETIRNMHCGKKSSSTEARDLPLPSKVGVNNSTRKASTGQKGSTANLGKKRMFGIFDSRGTTTTNENNVTAHSAKTTLQKEGPKDSTDPSKHNSRPKASAGPERTDILAKKKMSQILDSRSTSTTKNGQNITAHSAKNTFQEEDPKKLTNPSKTSLRPMKRSITSDTLTTRDPIITSSNKASVGQKRRTAILEKKKLSRTLDSRSASTTTNGKNITARSAKNTLQEEEPKDFTNPSFTSIRPTKKSKTSDTLKTRNPIITSRNKASVGQKRRTAILEKKKLSQTLDSKGASTTTNGQNIAAHSAKNTLQEEDQKGFTNPSLTSIRPMKRSKTSDNFGNKESYYYFQQ